MMTEVQRYFCEEIMERRDAMRVEGVIISIRAIAHNVGVSPRKTTTSQNTGI